MKKLLALVLCVVMVLSLAPAAFAEVMPDQTQTTGAPWPALNTSNKAIKNAKENIEYLYGTLAADNAVFGTVQAIDSIVVDLAKNAFDGVDGIDSALFGLGWGTISQDALVRNTKGILRNAVGNEIVKYLNNHMGDFAEVTTTYFGNGLQLTYTGKMDGYGSLMYKDTNGNIYGRNKAGDWFIWAGNQDFDAALKNDTTTGGNWQTVAQFGATVTSTQSAKYDPIAYANTFATAATKALTSEKSAAALQRLMYDLYTLKVYDDISDDLDDLQDAINAWQDGTNIFGAYGFNNVGAGDWSPYAMLPENFKNTVIVPTDLLVP